MSFNPRAHVGRDLGCVPLKCERVVVSIHAPTWGATFIETFFSLTSSSFNPRAHVGRDSVFSKCLNITVQSYEKCERFCGLMVK